MSVSAPHHLVFGNEKGGSGKSTLALHCVVHLMREGVQVGVIDLDGRQRTLSRYMENRAGYMQRTGAQLPLPRHASLIPSDRAGVMSREAEDQRQLGEAMDGLGDVDIIVFDCPGSHTYLSRLAHALADTLVTPMNDSFVDLDLLGEVEADTYEVRRLSHYAEMVWEARKNRSASELEPMDWVVTRNRLSTLSSANNQRVHAALEKLQKRIMFRYVPGLHERVIYRELFPRGLTMMDLDEVPDFGALQLSHVAARQEVRQLVEALRLPALQENSPILAGA